MDRWGRRVEDPYDLSGSESGSGFDKKDPYPTGYDRIRIWSDPDLQHGFRDTVQSQRGRRGLRIKGKGAQQPTKNTWLW
jgi:hypothetical protein